MNCLKCGKEMNQSSCPSCGFNITAGSFVTLFPLSQKELTELKKMLPHEKAGRKGRKTGGLQDQGETAPKTDQELAAKRDARLEEILERFNKRIGGSAAEESRGGSYIGSGDHRQLVADVADDLASGPLAREEKLLPREAYMYYTSDGAKHGPVLSAYKAQQAGTGQYTHVWVWVGESDGKIRAFMSKQDVEKYVKTSPYVRSASEEARRKAKEEARRKAEVEAKRKAEEEAKRKAEEEAKRKAEEEAQQKAKEDARRKAEKDAKREQKAAQQKVGRALVAIWVLTLASATLFFCVQNILSISYWLFGALLVGVTALVQLINLHWTKKYHWGELKKDESLDGYDFACFFLECVETVGFVIAAVCAITSWIWGKGNLILWLALCFAYEAFFIDAHLFCFNFFSKRGDAGQHHTWKKIVSAITLLLLGLALLFFAKNQFSVEDGIQSPLDLGELGLSKVVSQQYSQSENEIPSDLSYGWSDSVGGRIGVTMAEIDAGDLHEQIIFNSIKDSVIGDERNFVGARECTDYNNGADNVWNANLIEAECGKEYYVRLYCHNNNLEQLALVAQNTKVSFVLPSQSGKSIVVHGFVTSSNSAVDWYSDSVVFTCPQKFHLEYVTGSALLENNGIGANGGATLSDSVVGKWVNIGYSALDGNIPCGYQYASYITIRVRAIAG